MSSVYVAGIDVHKQVLMVVVGSSDTAEHTWVGLKCGTTTSELERLAGWLTSRGVHRVAMESTADWFPVWQVLEERFELVLAQPRSTQAPRGRKSDFADARRIVKRLLSDDLTVSYVPGPEQRQWRLLTRARTRLIDMKVMVRNQLEATLEDARIKLDTVVSDLLGVSGVRILKALSQGEADVDKLADLADRRVKATREQMREALKGRVRPEHQKMLAMALEHLALLDRQIAKLEVDAAEAMKAHEKVVGRLCEVPGIGPEAALQIIAEIGPDAKAFRSANKIASWVGLCPGRNESAEKPGSCRSPKGNKALRRLMAQVAHAGVNKKGCWIGTRYRSWLVRMGRQKAIWAIAHRLLRIVWKILHDGVRYVERATIPVSPELRSKRKQSLTAQLKRLGYSVQLCDLTSPEASDAPA
jgi:transposase